MGGGSVTMTNSTVSGNVTIGSGGGIFSNLGSISLTNVTVTNNSTTGTNGGGLAQASTGVITLDNTIVAGNLRGVTASDISGTVSGSFNLIGTGGSGGLVNGVNNNQVGVSDARLSPLANNGGPTQTHALLSGSPALDAGSNTLANNAGLTTDQRTLEKLEQPNAVPSPHRMGRGSG